MVNLHVLLPKCALMIIVLYCGFTITTSSHSHAAEIHVYAALQNNNLKRLREAEDELPTFPDVSDSGYLFGVSVVRPILQDEYSSEPTKHYFGMGIDILDLQGDTLIGYRAINYYYQINDFIRLGAFFGAASLDNRLPQNGYYSGGNLTYKNIMPKFDLMAGVIHGNGLARDKIDAEREFGVRPDFFINFYSTYIALQYRF